MIFLNFPLLSQSSAKEMQSIIEGYASSWTLQFKNISNILGYWEFLINKERVQKNALRIVVTKYGVMYYLGDILLCSISPSTVYAYCSVYHYFWEDRFYEVSMLPIKDELKFITNLECIEFLCLQKKLSMCGIKLSRHKYENKHA